MSVKSIKDTCTINTEFQCENQWGEFVCVHCKLQLVVWTETLMDRPNGTHYSSWQRINTGESVMRKRGIRMEGNDRKTDKEWKERETCVDMRRAGAYLTDNVVIVRQVVSVSLGSGRRGVTQFPYIWL